MIPQFRQPRVPDIYTTYIRKCIISSFCRAYSLLLLLALHIAGMYNSLKAMETTHDADHHPQKRRFPKIKRHYALPFFVIIFLVLGTTAAVLYSNGYRIGVNEGKPTLAKTGILNATSIPRGAQVYINNHPTTATDNTVNLTPGQYTIKITKEGYIPWEKNVIIKEQLVTNTDAMLYPAAPSLQSLSTFGIESPVMDPSGTKLAFRITGQSPRKNGIYVLDMTGPTFPVLIGQSSSTQVVSDVVDLFSEAHITWAPDGQQLLASTSGTLGVPTYYLLQANTFTETPQDVTATLLAVEDTWQTQRFTREQALIERLKPAVQRMIADHFKIIAWSPDDDKILYQATKSGELPIVIQPRRIGNNPLYERRDLEKDAIYVYNIREDVNTRVIGPTDPICNSLDPTCEVHPFRWFPDSRRLVYVNEKKIMLVEDDGSNMTTIYAGPFEDSYAFPWPDRSKLVILTNLGNNNIAPTLYTVSLK
jgi:hypothetical protein